MNYVKDANLNLTWKEVAPGGTILGGGTSLAVNTGDWRVYIPKFFEENCTHCMLCFPVCADSAIPVNKDGKREDFDFMHCKGCGVCYMVCPFGDSAVKKGSAKVAITWEKEDK
ncbi:MAG: 4Fe-4S binding protein [Defluviitaleaceae bacterium]|nr:4Fe-4S binding protein [Defluviitaleaceae bacterium]